MYFDYVEKNRVLCNPNKISFTLKPPFSQEFDSRILCLKKILNIVYTLI